MMKTRIMMRVSVLAIVLVMQGLGLRLLLWCPAIRLILLTR